MGLVYPTQFIPIAEQNLQILPIGEWVLRQTCLKIKHWISIGYVDICVSVNVTSVQLYRSDMYDLLKGLLNFYDIPGTSLELEITESGLLEDEGHAINELNKIRTLGIRIALDLCYITRQFHGQYKTTSKNDISEMRLCSRVLLC